MVGSIAIGLGLNQYPNTSYLERQSLGVNNLQEPTNNYNTSNTPSTGSVNKSECQTCKDRKYVDGSNESNVSFKSPGHISPGASKAVVSAHEQEHVSNARREGSKEGVQFISASVTLKTAACPECGSSYVAGGTTRTQIKYTESNPYDKARKTIEGSFLKGQNVDLVA